jgi:signal transduction histidine kinase
MNTLLLGSGAREASRGDVLALSPGGHVCLIYESSPAEQMPLILPFLRQGLEQRERCIYVADDQALDDLRIALLAGGLDVAAEEKRGALLLWTRKHWRQEGALDPKLKAEQVHSIIADALTDGFCGARFVIEMTWTLGPDIDVLQLSHWEATLNTILTPVTPARMICQYSRTRLGPGAIQAALETHRHALVGTEFYPNPYYSAPLLLHPGEPSDGNGTRADWMISQLRWARAVEDERQQRIRAEAALQEVEQSRRRMADLYELARSAAADLRETVAAKDEFLGILSHELKTPITTILGNAQVLRRTNATLSSDERLGALDDIEESADRLHRLIDNLLVLSRIESGQRIEREPHLARRIVEGVVAEHLKRHPLRQIDMEVDAPLTPVLLHRDYFEQVMRNLLSNAEKYSPPNAPIEIRIERDHEYLVVKVMDRGAGIPPEEAEHIFSAFYRSPTTAGRAKGAGVGLAVCRRLLEAQEGEIDVSPRDGGGSCFSVRLPNQPEAFEA